MGKSKGKVTPGGVITLGSVFVCSGRPSKAPEFNSCEKAKHGGNRESVSVVEEASGQTYQGLYC